MINKKTFVARVRKIGDSLGITIQKEIIKFLKIKPGDDIKVIIENLTENILSYKCLVCNHHFDSDEAHPYCPACDNENIELIVGEK